MSRTRHDLHTGRSHPRTLATAWKASAYDVDMNFVRAREDARWERYEPFAKYSPPTGGRGDAQAGPHLSFAGLKEARRDMRRDPMPFLRGLYSFVNEYGLLGQFWEAYPAGPVLPYGKVFVAPEALVDGRSGRLRLLDPATEGKDRLLALQDRLDETKYGAFFRTSRDDVSRTFGTDPVALPSELVLFPVIDEQLPQPNGPSRRGVPWNVVQEEHDALLVLDGRSFTGVSVLCHSEYTPLWGVHIDFFPFPSGKQEACPLVPEGGEVPVPDSSDEYLLMSLRGALEGAVSPYPVVGHDGQMEHGLGCTHSTGQLRKATSLEIGCRVTSVWRRRDCPIGGETTPGSSNWSVVARRPPARSAPLRSAASTTSQRASSCGGDASTTLAEKRLSAQSNPQATRLWRRG